MDLTKLKVAFQWPYTRPMVACRLDPLKRFVFCGSEDNVVERFRLSDGARTLLTGGHKTWVHGLAIAPDGSQLVSGGCEGNLTWWPVEGDEPKPVRTVEAHKGWIRQLAISPDGKLLASAGNDSKVRLWNLATGELVKELSGHTRDVYSLAWHSSSSQLCSGDLLGNVRLWDINTGEIIRSIEAKELHSFNSVGQGVDFGGVRALAISPDSKYLAVGGLHKATNPLGAVHEPLSMLYEFETFKPVRSQVTDGITGGGLWRLTWLPDGTLVGASGGSSGGWLLFWKPEADQTVHKFQLPNILRDMDLAYDASVFATAHHDGHVRITSVV